MGGVSLTARRHVGVEIKALWNGGLVQQKLDLLESDDVCELDDELLGVGTELGAEPSVGMTIFLQQ